MTGTGAQALVLTGTIAAGKTTLAEAISDELHEKGVRHGLLDLDWLGQVYPALDPADPFDLGLSLENLRAIVPNFGARGVERFVIVATITGQSELAALRAALPECEVLVARVHAPGPAILRRIERRDTGALRDDFRARALPLAVTIEAARVADFAIANDDGAVETAAAAALERLRWT